MIVQNMQLCVAIYEIDLTLRELNIVHKADFEAKITLISVELLLE